MVTKRHVYGLPIFISLWGSVFLFFAFSCGVGSGTQVTSGGSGGGGSSLTDGLASSQHRIFVTASSWSIADLDASGGGLTGADTICQSRALSATPTPFTRTYKAIMSATGVNAKDRLTINGAVYLFTAASTKTLVANDATDLWDGSVAASVNRTESAFSTVATDVWTGTNDAGSDFGNNCDDWTATIFGSVSIGLSTATNGEWLEQGILMIGCDSSSAALYCISQ